MKWLEQVSENLQVLQEKRPLVHHITNYVTVNDCANMTLAIGASPVMADDQAEVAEMVSYASALVLNIGTLNSRSIESMLIAGKQARSKGIPVIFDPVGVGATRLRTDTAGRIIQEVQPQVIRGNMSEIKLLAGSNVAIKGVDSVASEQGAREIAQELAGKLACVVAITGKQDVISDGKRTCLIDNGHEMLAQVTGTGCMTTSLVGSYCGVGDDCFIGAIGGILSMGLAGELAQASLQDTESVGTFRMRLFDAVSSLNAETLLSKGRIYGE